MALRRLLARWGDNDGPSAVVEHGANPGLVSHFTKQALVEIADAVVRDGLLGERHAEIVAARDAGAFNELARLLDVRAIHVAERDTQVSSSPKQVGEFVNTWSVDGFYEEGVAPAEMGWGTHEKALPPLGLTHSGEGPLNQICLAQMAHKTLVHSCVPSGPIVGMVIRHGEAFTICDHLTVWEGDVAAYRPTVHYAYCPADAPGPASSSSRATGIAYPERQRILNDEITSGRTSSGCSSWATPTGRGGPACRRRSRRRAPSRPIRTPPRFKSPRPSSARWWMLRVPREGVRVPDELPWREILDVASPTAARSGRVRLTGTRCRPTPTGSTRWAGVGPRPRRPLAVH